MLDADCAADALIMILSEHHPNPSTVLDAYSDSRRKVFAFFVDPTSTQNKMRVHSNPPETAAQDDWYFRMMQHPTPKQLEDLMKPYFETWRSDLRKVVAELEEGAS